MVARRWAPLNAITGESFWQGWGYPVGDPPPSTYWMMIRQDNAPAASDYSATGWYILENAVDTTDMMSDDNLDVQSNDRGNHQMSISDEDTNSKYGMSLHLDIDATISAWLLSTYSPALIGGFAYDITSWFDRAYIVASSDGVGDLRWWQLDTCIDGRLYEDGGANHYIKWFYTGLGTQPITEDNATEWAQIKAALDYRNANGYGSYPMYVQVEFTAS